MTISVSVIIPIYNVESYLRQCIESVIGQHYAAMEIILVDDGSTDGCAAICDEYAGQDQRIVVIHKENGGLSDARNAGIAIAGGEYLLFLDSDDYFVAEQFIGRMIEKARRTGCDILYGSCYTFDEVTGVGEDWPLNFHEDELAGLHGQQFLALLLRTKSYNTLVYLHLYKRALIVDNQLYFAKGFVHEDEEWTPRVFLTANKYAIFTDRFLMRRIRAGSITTLRSNASTYDRAISLIVLSNRLLTSLRDATLLPELQHHFFTQCPNLTIESILNIYELTDPTYIKRAKDIIRPNLEVFRIAARENWRYGLIYYIFQILGVDMGRVLLQTYLRRRN